MRCVGTKVQILTSFCAQKASHSTFFCFLSWENGREDYVDRSFCLKKQNPLCACESKAVTHPTPSDWQSSQMAKTVWMD